MSEETCDNPPCLHVVSDEKKKNYAIFIEDSNGIILWIERDKLLEAYKKLMDLEKRGFKEATLEEVDELARIKLGAEREEEWE